MRRRAVSALAVAVALAGITGCTDAAPPLSPPLSEPTSRVAPNAAPPAPGSPAASTLGYADLVERVQPSVVTVRVGSGQGSGVVFRPDIVLTNQHVVSGGKQVTIEYADGTSSPGTVLATDRITDIAVVRTERTGLPVPRYRTESPRPGEVVLALGSPLGFEGTVTSGIVSGLGREIPGSARESQALVDLIQTDAAISPGNSGGALIDTSGRVVGINEAYLPPGSGAVSIGFAIPSATAVDVAEQLLADGTATHSYLGVSLGQLTPDIRRAFGIQTEKGALALIVEPDGPAAKAGIQRGDVVTEFANQPVDSVEDLVSTLRTIEPNQEVSITLERRGEPVTLPVTVGARPMP